MAQIDESIDGITRVLEEYVEWATDLTVSVELLTKLLEER